MQDPERPDQTKDSNPKQAFGDRKVPLSAVPMPVVFEEGLVLLNGAMKYGRHNWRGEGVRFSTYFDAAMRHLSAWWEGQDIDPDSGLHHLAHARACLAVVRDSEMQGNATDDRPPRSPSNWLASMNAASVEVRGQVESPREPLTALGEALRQADERGRAARAVGMGLPSQEELEEELAREGMAIQPSVDPAEVRTLMPTEPDPVPGDRLDQADPGRDSLVVGGRTYTVPSDLDPKLKRQIKRAIGGAIREGAGD